MMGHSSTVSNADEADDSLAAQDCHETESPLGPTDHLNHRWRPWTFNEGTLISMIFFTLGMIVSLALLRWQSRANSAIFLAPTEGGISKVDTFLYASLQSSLFGMGCLGARLASI
jgi:hypothetical protein